MDGLLQRRRLSAHERCPYCHDGLAAVRVICPACQTPHHQDCLEELGGCSVFGCEGRVHARPLRAALRSGLQRVRARSRARAARFLEANATPSGPEALWQEVSPWRCEGCEELHFSDVCACGEPLSATCAGTGAHCARCATQSRARTRSLRALALAFGSGILGLGLSIWV